MKLYWFLLSVAAVWRVTHLLTAEAGPWDSLAKLRQRTSGSFWGSALDCFYCLSLWVAFPVAIAVGSGWPERVLLWPALSGAAILLERVTAKQPGVPAASYYYEPEEVSHVLRSEIDETERSLSTTH